MVKCNWGYLGVLERNRDIVQTTYSCLKVQLHSCCYRLGSPGLQLILGTNFMKKDHVQEL